MKFTTAKEDTMQASTTPVSKPRRRSRILIALAVALAAVAASAGSASAFTVTRDASGNLIQYRYFYNQYGDALVRCNVDRSIRLNLSSTMSLQNVFSGPLDQEQSAYIQHWEYSSQYGKYIWATRFTASQGRVFNFDGAFMPFHNDFLQTLDRAGYWKVTFDVTWTKIDGYGNVRRGLDSYDADSPQDYTGPNHGQNGAYCYFAS